MGRTTPDDGAGSGPIRRSSFNKVTIQEMIAEKKQ